MAAGVAAAALAIDAVRQATAGGPATASTTFRHIPAERSEVPDRGRGVLDRTEGTIDEPPRRPTQIRASEDTEACRSPGRIVPAGSLRVRNEEGTTGVHHVDASVLVVRRGDSARVPCTQGAAWPNGSIFRVVRSRSPIFPLWRTSGGGLVRSCAGVRAPVDAGARTGRGSRDSFRAVGRCASER